MIIARSCSSLFLACDIIVKNQCWMCVTPGWTFKNFTSFSTLSSYDSYECYSRQWLFPQKELIEFYVLLTVHLSIIFVNKPSWCTILSYMFISNLYMFRAVMCPSSGELIVSMRYLVYVTLCRWPSGIRVGMNSDLHSRRSSTQSDIYLVSHWYN